MAEESVIKMTTFSAMFPLLLALIWVNCSMSADTSTTEAPTTPVTAPSCVTKSEQTQEAAQDSCTETEKDKSYASSTEKSFISHEVSSLSSTKSHSSSQRSKTTESLHQTKEMTTSNVLHTTLNAQTSTVASGKKGSDSVMSMPNNVSASGNKSSADNIKQSTTSIAAGNEPDTTYTTSAAEMFMKTNPTPVPSAGEFPGEDSTVTRNPTPNSEFITLSLNITAPYCLESLCERSDSAVNCYCDSLCYFYNDCCYSEIEKLLGKEGAGTHQLADLIQEKVIELENQTIMLKKDLTACVGDDKNNSAFIMVKGCDESTKTSEDITEKCELSAEWYNYQNIPVDHVVNDEVLATFKNIYCALCNGVPQNEIVFWNIDITCEVANQETLVQMELEEIAQMEECALIPNSVFENSLRKCLTKEKSLKLCNKTDNANMVDLCSAYVYPITDTIDSEWNPSQVYKNPHCAACVIDKLNKSAFYCVDLFTRYAKQKPENIVGPVDLQVIFDFSREKGIVSKLNCVTKLTCKTYEVYDCASKKCRQLYCQKGEIPVEGKCKKTTESDSDFDGSVVTETLKPVDQFDNVTKGEEKFIFELLSNDEANLVFYALSTTGERVLQIMYETIKQFGSKIMNINQMRDCLCLEIRILADEINMFTDVFPELVHAFDMIEERESRGYSLIPMFVEIRNFQELSTLECSEGKLITDKNASIVGDNTNVTTAANSMFALALPSSAMTVYEQNCKWVIGYDKRIGVLPSLVATCFICDDRPSLNCSMIAYAFNEVILSNKSMKIINTSLTFDERDFVIFQNRVFICAHKVTRIESFINIFTFSAHQRILSLLTSLVSAVSAAIVVVTHLCLKRLRNIHGLNLSALSVSTIVMHLLLIVQVLINSRTVCIVFSIALHFVLLNIFVWMNIIGYDMARIFVSDTLISQSAPFKRFLGYYFVSLLFPSLIITVAASLDFTDSAFKPNYGDNDICWLSNGRSIMMFVIGPVVLSLLLNFSFFTFTVKAIYSKAKQSKFAQNRSYFIVYLKLTLILGLTWIVGIIGAFADQEWLWVVHLVLNGLQGFSLLICSVVNFRNIRHLRASLKSAMVSTNGKVTHSAATEDSNL